MTQPRVAIASTLSLPMELHAVNYWVENFAFGTNDISDLGHEYSSYVLPYWQRARQDSSLQLALLAVAHAAFGHARRSSKAIRDSNKLYYRALMQTKSDIEHVQAGETEKLLVTIMLLNSFDVSTLLCNVDQIKDVLLSRMLGNYVGKKPTQPSRSGFRI